MARTVKTSITLSPEAHSIGVQLAKIDRMANGSEATLSSIIDSLLIANAPGPQKQIEPVKEGARTIGWAAYYGDHCVGIFDGAGSKPAAEQALDAYVWEELHK